MNPQATRVLSKAARALLSIETGKQWSDWFIDISQGEYAHGFHVDCGALQPEHII